MLVYFYIFSHSCLPPRISPDENCSTRLVDSCVWWVPWWVWRAAWGTWCLLPGPLWPPTSSSHSCQMSSTHSPQPYAINLLVPSSSIWRWVWIRHILLQLKLAVRNWELLYWCQELTASLHSSLHYQAKLVLMSPCDNQTSNDGITDFVRLQVHPCWDTWLKPHRTGLTFGNDCTPVMTFFFFLMWL